MSLPIDLPVQTSLLDDVPEAPMAPLCCICRSPIATVRTDARYCSTTCRVRAHRRRQAHHH